jgi:DNA-binding beta-propeller fold protein YncE
MVRVFSSFRPLAVFASVLLLAACGKDTAPEGPFVWDEAWGQGIALGEVTGLAIDSQGFIYAVRRGGTGGDGSPAFSDPVVKIDPATGEVLARFGSGLLKEPHGLAVDSFDTLWVTDRLGHRIVQFSGEGEVLFAMGEEGAAGTGADRLGGPMDLGFMSNGEMVVADGDVNARVAVYFGNGTYRDEWGTGGTGWGEFRTLNAIAIAPNDRIYVSDLENERVQLFSAGGNFLGIFDSSLVGRPLGLDTDGEGNLYVASTHKPQKGGVRIVKLSSEGALLKEERLLPVGGREHRLEDIAVAPDGTVFVADAGLGRILRFTESEG